MMNRRSAKTRMNFYISEFSHYQMGLYILLVQKNQINPTKVIECIEEYKKVYLDINRTKEEVLESINTPGNFTKFLKIVTSKTGVKFGMSWRHGNKPKEIIKIT